VLAGIQDGLIEAVADGFPDQRMVRNADVAGEIFRAGRLVGKNGGHQIVGAHALDGRRHLPSAGIARDGQRPGGIPTPAGPEHGRSKHGLREHRLDGFRPKEFEHDIQWKGMLLA